MKKFTLTALSAGIAMTAIVSTTAIAANDGTKGNGLPQISMKDAWSLNVHAYDTCPNANGDDNGHSIVIEAHLGGGHPDLFSSNDVQLRPATDFNMIDSNACDGTPARIELPSDIRYNYDIYVKFVGKPGTQMDPVLCATDTGTADVYCYTGSQVTERNGGKDGSKFYDYTRQLMSIQEPAGLDLCAGTLCELFETGMENYFWDWQATDGAKAILKFVPCATDARDGTVDPTTISCR